MADSPCYTLIITPKYQTFMQKILVTMMVLTLTIAAQAQRDTIRRFIAMSVKLLMLTVSQ